MGCRVMHNVAEAIREADIIHLLRIQHERQRKSMFPSIGEYTSLYGLNRRGSHKNKTETRSSCTQARLIAAWRLTAKSPIARVRCHEAWASFRIVSSPKGLPSNCNPIGSFGLAVKPQGRLTPQMPARLQEMVKMSDR